MFLNAGKEPKMLLKRIFEDGSVEKIYSNGSRYVLYLGAEDYRKEGQLTEKELDELFEEINARVFGGKKGVGDSSSIPFK
jgi:hypothetical protein